ncbi:hypothetical protein CBW65_20540 [Tumebacillus avium]|uniref:HTH cro/C1-type domain-containing protein n=1 Tax=Tumebacillus avium TaxID=1903704 RepID=A0A1Y0ISY6_9BACL|nr:tetratricopeptide repeat protein [Tumebacillus avium]ARU63099.1 hypothetical protein CBW65_20540 [Tumebacillus avium]
MLTDTYARIGQRVKAYRKERDLSQDELADGICSRQTISLLENGQHFPSVDFMQKIAERLSIPLHEIMVDAAKELDVKVQLEIMQVYIERGEYSEAFSIFDELESRDDLLIYQKRELALLQAECLMRTGKAEQSVKILTGLQQSLEQQRESDDYFMATLYDKLGTAYYFLSQIATAHAHYMRAYQLSQRFSEFNLTAARITYNFGKACRMIERHAEAVELLSRAKAFFDNISDTKRLALTLFELGIASRDRNEIEQAEEYLNESQALFKALNVMGLARRVRESYAYTILAQKDPKRAIEELRECVNEFENAGDTVQLAYSYARMSKLHLRQGETEEAGNLLRSALRLFTENEAEHNFEFATVYQGYAEYSLNIKMMDDCIAFSFKASEFFGKMGFDRDAADSLKLSVKAYRELGMLEEALDVSEKVNELLCRFHDQFRLSKGGE